MGNELRIAYLIDRALCNTLTSDESIELHQWIAASEKNRAYYESRVTTNWAITEGLPIVNRMDEKRTIQLLDGKMKNAQSRPMNRFGYYRPLAAAAAVLCILTGAYFMLSGRKQQGPPNGGITSLKKLILPGKDRALLKLSDGRTIDMDSVQIGEIAAQGNAQIIKTNAGQLQYRTASKDLATESKEPVRYNTLITPKSSQFQLTLPDGTKVWLNNASQLKYPVAFTGNTRTVELIGEAYLEVAPNKSKPFIVKASNQVIQVLGTRFNISAYPDDHRIRTVLVGGAVKVSLNNQSVILQPGRQTESDGSRLLEGKANLRSAIAWRDGFFNFDNAPASAVVVQLARWYGFDPVYPGGNIPTVHFDGVIDRHLNFQTVMVLLEKQGLHCEIDKNSVTITQDSVVKKI